MAGVYLILQHFIRKIFEGLFKEFSLSGTGTVSFEKVQKLPKYRFFNRQELIKQNFCQITFILRVMFVLFCKKFSVFNNIIHEILKTLKKP